MATVILALGSNLGDRLTNLRSAVNLLKNLPNFTVQQISPLYLSTALLPKQAPSTWNIPYVNLVLTANSMLEPLDLLAKIKTIEISLGRKLNHLHWSPRTIDIDIIAWDQENIAYPELTIPHPRMLERQFVLAPLADLAPNWRYPGTGSYQGYTAIELLNLLTLADMTSIQQLLHRIDTPQLMGIINLTPNSFSADGINEEQLLDKIEDLVRAGSVIIDLGAEATNPDIQPITAQQELQRIIPALQLITPKLAKMVLAPKISIDTRHALVAQAALKYGVDFINDVSGLQDPEMRAIISHHNCGAILMHSISIPASRDIVYPPGTNVVQEVYNWATQQLDSLEQIGISRDRLIVDIGIGFGKTAEQSLELISQISKFHNLQVPLLVGHSRKSFLARFTSKNPTDRDSETAFLSWQLAQQKVSYLRVHNVELSSRFFKLGAALANSATV